jgi:predicted nucleic acid-binding protein
MVIIDTSAWVEFFRRNGDLRVKLAVKGLLDTFEGALCGPVEMEFLGGARPEEMETIRGWFGLIPYVRNKQEIWQLAAENYAKLKAAGLTIPWNDILIASIALDKNIRVYAHDKHFQAMSDKLGIRLYTPGYNGIFNPEA